MSSPRGSARLMHRPEVLSSLRKLQNNRQESSLVGLLQSTLVQRKNIRIRESTPPPSRQFGQRETRALLNQLGGLRPRFLCPVQTGVCAH